MTEKDVDDIVDVDDVDSVRTVVGHGTTRMKIEMRTEAKDDRHPLDRGNGAEWCRGT